MLCRKIRVYRQGKGGGKVHDVFKDVYEMMLEK